MPTLPTGTVTFLFTDIEGSTHLLQHLGDRYAEALGQHQALLRAAFAAHGGAEVDTQGDAFFIAFPTAPAAVAAAADATRALANHAWPDSATLRVRMGLHTGTPQLVGDHYVGLDVHRAARIAAAGHGGQVLLSASTRVLTEHDLPEGATLRAMGTHRLKDLHESEPLFQLVLPGLPVDFPALRTLDAHPHNLPLQPTPLLGREEVLATVGALLRREGVRLVTLTGPGGIGKTRLAIQVAAELVEDFVDGVWFVRLSRLTDPTLVVPTIAQTLGLKEQSSQPIAELLREHLRAKHLLLVLDNFEQVVGAAADMAALRESAPHLTLLVTSRVALHLRGERALPLVPLPLPDLGHLPAPEGLSQYAAVALFIERAQEARPDFAVTVANAPAIAEVCARLDGLPLAIELAAARVRVLSPEALLGRLSTQLKVLTGGARDLEARQQTMRATIAWSEALLSPAERVLFRRLAVFVGGCTLEAAEAVCLAPEGVTPLAVDLLDTLSTLVDHNLVQQREEGGEARFGMLHVIREFALEQLEVSGEAEPLHQAHANYYLALAEQASPGLEGTMQPGWLARLERDLDNLRAAVSWAREQGDVTLGLRLACAWSDVWYVRGSLREGRGLVEQLLALVPVPAEGQSGTIPNTLLARALHWAAFFAYWQGDYDIAVPRWQSALTLARQERDVALAVQVLKRLADYAYNNLGDADQAEAYYGEGLALATALGDAQPLASMLANWGAYAYFRGDYEEAVARTERALQLQRDAGIPASFLTAVWLDTLARAAVRQGALARATALEHEAFAIWRNLGALARFPEVFEVLAMRDAAAGAGVQAARLLGAAESLRQAVGARLQPIMQADIEVVVAPARAALGEAAWATAFAAGQALSLEEAIAEALDTTGG
jgi:predicted ATPase/class 3 adenylate cyclase